MPLPPARGLPPPLGSAQPGRRHRARAPAGPAPRRPGRSPGECRPRRRVGRMRAQGSPREPLRPAAGAGDERASRQPRVAATKKSPKPICAEPKWITCRCGRPPGPAALSTAFGPCSRSATTSHRVDRRHRVDAELQPERRKDRGQQPAKRDAGERGQRWRPRPPRRASPGRPRRTQRAAGRRAPRPGPAPRTSIAERQRRQGGNGDQRKPGERGRRAGVTATTAITTTIESGGSAAHQRLSSVGPRNGRGRGSATSAA